ncbi:uncharacterized protein LOC133822821 isoform X2 [Humulus lupulus]|uniref:uncharacterized protein LOC133822821 isoform X2 n=1 Tax=Humulus lupulus TaxID=3486 RepID=UPI002B408393|nr:uncharacterized protein LOC133822821 isoform X2 [Humulus lupulus]
MIPLKIHQPHHLSFFLSQNTHLPSFLSSVSHRPRFHFKPNSHWFSHSPSHIPIPRSSNLTFKSPRVSGIETLSFQNDEDRDKSSPQLQLQDLSSRGMVYQKTLALVECSMFAALTGLVYFLSNSLAIENYFGCFFSLPIVISSMRWGIPAGRKTMVATTMLLLVLSGPVKALTYLLKHGLVGLTMGALWRSGADWKLSIFLCTIVLCSPNCSRSWCCRICFDYFVYNQGKHTCFDYYKYTCFSNILDHCIGSLYSSVHECDLHYLRGSGFPK